MLFDQQETISRVLETATAFVRFRYKAFWSCILLQETEYHCILL